MENPQDQSIANSRERQSDADGYWHDRLSRSFNLQGVGLIGRSLAFNRWGYRARRAALGRLVSDASGARVLDVGSGTGYWIDHWHRLGAAAVSGLDLTELSVDRLRLTFPGDRFERADIRVSIPFEGPFDLISAIDVLLHVTDDDGYRSGLANLREVAAPGARLVLLEPISSGRPRPMAPGADSRTRSLAEVEEALGATGWTLERRFPTTWLLSNPVEVEPRAAYLILSAWWAALRPAYRSELMSSIVCPPIYWVDRLLCQLQWSPSSKAILARAI